jgi:hypothetical protein
VSDFFTLLRVEGESGSVFDRNMEGIIEARKDLLDVMMGEVWFLSTRPDRLERQRYMQQATEEDGC